MAVQKAYERLQLGGQGGQGPQPWRLLLLLKVLLGCAVMSLSSSAAGMQGRCKSDPGIYQTLPELQHLLCNVARAKAYTSGCMCALEQVNQSLQCSLQGKQVSVSRLHCVFGKVK